MPQMAASGMPWEEFIRTRIFAFGFSDSPLGGVVPRGAIQILRNSLNNIAGLTVDDDGSLYFQLLDNPQSANGAAIFKVAEGPRTVCQTPNRINRVISSIPSGLTNGIGLNTALSTATALTAGGFRLTNYSGNANVFGNIVALASGAGNVLYSTRVDVRPAAPPLTAS